MTSNQVIKYGHFEEPGTKVTKHRKCLGLGSSISFWDWVKPGHPPTGLIVRTLQSGVAVRIRRIAPLERRGGEPGPLRFDGGSTFGFF